MDGQEHIQLLISHGLPMEHLPPTEQANGDVHIHKYIELLILRKGLRHFTIPR